jgi:hypothetical protein
MHKWPAVSGAKERGNADLTVSGTGTAGGTLHVAGTWEAPGRVGKFKVSGALGGRQVGSTRTGGIVARRGLTRWRRKKKEEKMMKHKLTSSSLLVAALLLTLSQSAAAISLWYVDEVHGSDQNNCRTPVTACKTIGHAISLAGSGDAILVAAATYQENLNIGFSLTVLGSGVGTPIIDGGGVNRVVTVSSASARVGLANLTIRNGFGATGGGGIFNRGTLTVTNSTVSGNAARGMPGKGGGILNLGTLTVTNSTVTGNSVSGAFGAGWGGGIENQGTAAVNNSTVSGNSATAGGGGIFNLQGSVTINNSTVSGNSVHFAGDGGGIAGTVTLQNSIVASNSGGNCKSGVVSNGYNLSSDGTCNFHNTGDLNNTDPKLGPLQNNGGPTQTEALLPGSPAIDAGNPSGCTDGSGHLLTTDQRGMPRPDHEDTGGCDMGAYERQTD